MFGCVQNTHFDIPFVRKRKKKQEKEAKVQDDEKGQEQEELPPVTPRTGYDLSAPGFRFVQNTAENYEPFLGETSKEPFMKKYETMKTAEKEYFILISPKVLLHRNS